MPDKKISELPVGGRPLPGDILVCVESGVTVQIPVSYLGGSLSGTGQMLYNNGGSADVTDLVSYTVSAGDVTLGVANSLGQQVLLFASAAGNGITIPYPGGLRNFTIVYQPGDSTVYLSTDASDASMVMQPGGVNVAAFSYGSGFLMNAGYYIGWTSGDPRIFGDTLLRRGAAGVIELNDAAFGTPTALHAHAPDGATSSLSAEGVDGGTVPVLDVTLVSAGRIFSVGPAGELYTNQVVPGSTLGSVIGSLPIYDTFGTLLGYLPLYDSIS